MREGCSSLPKAEGSRRLCLHDMQELMYMYHIPSANPVRLGREGGREGERERTEVQRVIQFIHVHELKNISLSVAPLLMERRFLMGF